MSYLGRFRSASENVIKINLKEIECWDMGCVRLVGDRLQKTDFYKLLETLEFKEYWQFFFLFKFGI
jgi:hypothetical protein